MWAELVGSAHNKALCVSQTCSDIQEIVAAAVVASAAE